MKLEDAQQDRRARGEALAEAQIASFVDAVCDQVQLASVPNFRQVGPDARKKLRGLINHYRKMAKPFSSCVLDNAKRFGSEGAKKVCAVLKDLQEGTTKWRKGGRKSSMSLASERITDVDLIDNDLFALLTQIADVDYQSLLAADEALADQTTGA